VQVLVLVLVLVQGQARGHVLAQEQVP